MLRLTTVVYQLSLMYCLPLNVALKWFCRVHDAAKLGPRTFRVNRRTVVYAINAL